MRRYWLTDNIERLGVKGSWANMAGVGRVESQVEVWPTHVIGNLFPACGFLKFPHMCHVHGHNVHNLNQAAHPQV